MWPLCILIFLTVMDKIVFFLDKNSPVRPVWLQK